MDKTDVFIAKAIVLSIVIVFLPIVLGMAWSNYLDYKVRMAEAQRDVVVAKVYADALATVPGHTLGIIEQYRKGNE